jgi:Tol biopolymer transport system component
MATAQAILTGTATPPPPNLATATYTPLPTNTPPLYWLDEVTPWSISPTPSRTPAPPIPKALRGKILFLSDRQSAAGEDPKVFALDPATGRVALVTGSWPHALASIRDRYSPDGKYMTGVRDWTVDVEKIVDEAVTVDQMPGYQVYVIQLSDGFTWGLTFSRTSYDPAWSPRGDLIAFVSQEEEGKQPDHNASGGDEIYVITPQGKEKRRLTFNTWEWDKHPTFSPDGSKIVYYSNQETGRKQLWIVNTDGSGRRVLLHSPYNDWDPVWVK